MKKKSEQKRMLLRSSPLIFLYSCCLLLGILFLFLFLKPRISQNLIQDKAADLYSEATALASYYSKLYHKSNHSFSSSDMEENAAYSGGRVLMISKEGKIVNDTGSPSLQNQLLRKTSVCFCFWQFP
ncbi:hypothetical protein FACS189418_9080 [Clostridia bacterium]|nr:hypothetical protein FACS189418_9080 [Clostridia bacterium]